jgi:hypothetical protein
MEVSMVRIRFVALGIASTLLAANAGALTPADLLRDYEASARRASPAFPGFSPARGHALFDATHGREWSCSSCHTQNPAQAGRHAKTGKTIEPLTPAANPERFTSIAQAEKWFRRNCNDVLGRECTTEEKGDVLAYLLQIGGGR